MTIKKEMRLTAVRYCDYCKKEFNDYSCKAVGEHGKKQLHFHSMYKEGKKTCFEKWEKERG